MSNRPIAKVGQLMRLPKPLAAIMDLADLKTELIIVILFAGIT